MTTQNADIEKFLDSCYEVLSWEFSKEDSYNIDCACNYVTLGELFDKFIGCKEDYIKETTHNNFLEIFSVTLESKKDKYDCFYYNFYPYKDNDTFNVMITFEKGN